MFVDYRQCLWVGLNAGVVGEGLGIGGESINVERSFRIDALENAVELEVLSDAGRSALAVGNVAKLAGQRQRTDWPLASVAAGYWAE